MDHHPESVPPKRVRETIASAILCALCGRGYTRVMHLAVRLVHSVRYDSWACASCYSGNFPTREKIL